MSAPGRRWWSGGRGGRGWARRLERRLPLPRRAGATCGGATLILAFGLGVAGCGEGETATYADPTALVASSTQNGVTLTVLSPTTSFVEQPDVAFRVQVERVGGAGALDVWIGLAGGLSMPAEAQADVFSRPLTLVHGRNEVLVEVRSADGRLLRDGRYAIRYDGDAPGLRLTSLRRPGAGEDCGNASTPLPRPIVNGAGVCVEGEVTRGDGDAAVDGVGVESPAGQASASVGADGSFVVFVPLAPDAVNRLRVTASDRTTATADVRHDGTPPVVHVTSPGATFATADAVVAVEGTATDDVALDGLRLESGSGGVTYLPVEAAWRAEVRLDPGNNALRVVATDTAGNETSTNIVAMRERVIRLQAATAAPAPVSLRLDRTALELLLDADDREQVRLLTLPLRPTIRAALTRLVDPVAYGVDTSTWGDAEWNLQRLLVTTPDSADLTGSSLESLLTLSEGVGLPAPRLTAQLLDVGVTTPFLSVDTLTDVFVDGLVATHPAVERDEAGEPAITVTLADALDGLDSLAERFGPAGEHPGFLVGSTSATLLEPGFALTVDARSSLRVREGVDASAGSKDYLYQSDGGRVLSFDFDDSTTFAVVGLVNEPTIDLRVRIDESPAYFVVGTDRDARPDGETGAARGDSPVWDEAPWNLERLIAEGLYQGYRDRFAATGFTRTLRYDAGAIRDAAVITWDRGWVTIRTSGGLGAPPEPFYVWDLFTEVAQLRLHDGGLAEGEADVEFVLERLPVGLTADELVDALAPTLETQQDLLSDLLLGRDAASTSQCDLFVEAATDGGEVWLMFRGDDDGAAGRYARPGFFADIGLNERVSERVVASGSDDTAREKLRARAGRVVYFADDENRVYRLRVVATDAAGADVVVTPVDEAP